MNILIFSPQLYPCKIGGMELFNYYFIKYLSKCHDISVLTNCNRFEIKEVNFIQNKKKNIIFFYLNTFIKLVFNRNFDLIIFPYTSNSPLIYPFLLFNMIFRIHYIIIIHGGGMYQWRPVFFQKKFFKEAFDIIAVSKPIKLEYEKRIEKDIKLIPPLVPFRIAEESEKKLRVNNNFKERDLIIISVGSLKKIKGPEHLLDAFIKLGKNYMEINHLKLIYIGDGPLKTELEEKVRLNDLNNFIIFMGTIPHEQVNDFYKIANIYIIPSLFEGTPLSLLEAMFNALPIIGSNVSGINNIIQHKVNGLLFEVEDSDDLKNNIKYIIQNMENSIKLGFKAKECYKETYDYEDMIRSYNKIFSKIKE